jgi:hypothetical protein
LTIKFSNWTAKFVFTLLGLDLAIQRELVRGGITGFDGQKSSSEGENR